LLVVFAYFYRIFINDIIIFSNTLKNYIQYLIQIFELFTLRNIALFPTKSYLAYPNIELLRF
ncbi:hypothetical protein GE21DRAFT_1222884, partial [Neurospora crassa]